MNEVEKMYEDCNIKKIRYCEVEDECPFMFGHRCEDCDMKPKPEYYIYPPFTAEKQLELIKWLAKQPLTIDNVDGEFEFLTGCKLSDFGNFEESLAEIINNLWQDLAEEERKQIKNILELEVKE